MNSRDNLPDVFKKNLKWHIYNNTKYHSTLLSGWHEKKELLTLRVHLISSLFDGEVCVANHFSFLLCCLFCLSSVCVMVAIFDRVQWLSIRDCPFCSLEHLLLSTPFKTIMDISFIESLHYHIHWLKNINSRLISVTMTSIHIVVNHSMKILWHDNRI